MLAGVGMDGGVVSKVAAVSGACCRTGGGRANGPEKSVAALRSVICSGVRLPIPVATKGYSLF